MMNKQEAMEVLMTYGIENVIYTIMHKATDKQSVTDKIKDINLVTSIYLDTIGQADKEEPFMNPPEKPVATINGVNGKPAKGTIYAKTEKKPVVKHYKPKKCIKCGKEFIPRSGKTLTCDICKDIERTSKELLDLDPRENAINDMKKEYDGPTAFPC